MTLNEAIKHCEEITDYDCYNDKQMKCAEEHRQLAEWLRDYQKLLTGKSSEFELLKDGTLVIESDTDLMTVNRILLSQRDTHWGVLFYPDEDNARNSDLINNHDTISRQDAIEALGEEPPVWYDGENEIAERDQWRRDVNAIKAVPSAQPERKKGHWVEIGDEPCDVYECNQCRTTYDTVDNTWDLPNFCPNCGADMRGDSDDER